MADPEITTAGKSVFLNLLSRMDKKGYCYPAVNTMEDETGYCERTIQRQTNKLGKRLYRKSRTKSDEMNLQIDII